ncbi:MAG TPA: TraB/GumN family protein [Gammaproteobacteria bacterium]|nr:TraB/GumN family protein [Gammaproteobacteria bacterium]
MQRCALLSLALAGSVAVAGGGGTQEPGSAATTIEEITIIGRYPGPPLWRVSSGERVLFIFGELSPVPKGLDWDPRNAERVLERAETVIGAPRVSATTLNPIRLFRLFRAARRLARNPSGTTLADQLPPELYARYRVLHARHLPGKDEEEDLRPALAALRLHGAALDDVGLTTDSGVGKTMRRLVRRSRAEEAEILIETEPETVIEELGKVTREAELTCFATIMTSIETDLAAMKERANAWAIGDVYALRRFDYPDSQGNCLAMLFSAGGLAQLRDELYADWLAEAERALANDNRSFSVLPMRELVAADGLLAQLEARGYTVTPP